MRIGLSFLLSVLAFASQGADWLASTNRANWAGTGVQGGIPNRTTIYTNFWQTNTTGQIQGGLNNCPSNQVVLLHAGDYTNTSGWLFSVNETTLRGETNAQGWPTTIVHIDGTSAGTHYQVVGNQTQPSLPQDNWNYVTSRTVSNGATYGSTSVTLSNAPTGLQVGDIIWIDEENVYPLVSWSTAWGRGGNRAFFQGSLVTNISGTTVQFSPPLLSPDWDSFSPGSPGVYYYAARPLVRCGVEDIAFIRESSAPGANPNGFVIVNNANQFWVKNCKFTQLPNGGWGFRPCWSIFTEMCDSYVTLADAYGSSTYSIFCYYTCHSRFYNNITFHQQTIVTLAEAVGNVVAYNYLTNETYAPDTYLSECLNTSHGGHCTVNLFEGNMIPTWYADHYHGNSSHHVTVWSRHQGWEAGKDNGLLPINVWSNQFVMLFANNVLGTAGVQNGYQGFYTPGQFNIWDVQSDSLVTALFKNNYNFYNNAIPESESLGSDTVSNSYYLASKPAWFGDRPWPPFSPTSVTAAAIDATNLPAGYRFVYSNWPASTNGDGGGSTGSTTRVGTGVRLGTGVVWR